MSVSKQTIEQILAVKYVLPNGKLNSVFVKNKEHYGHYDCLLCSVFQLPPQNMVEHVKGRRHKENIGLVDIETSLEKVAAPNNRNCSRNHDRNVDSEVDVSRREERRSSEYVSHQHEGERQRETSTLQVAVDGIRDKAMIGMEYILDVQSNCESSYHCILCQEIFDRISGIVSHVLSYNHRLNYLKNLFPKVFEEVSYLIELVCEGIEQKYGRHNSIELKKCEFLENKEKFSRLGSTFTYTNENIDCLQLILKDKNGRASPESFMDTISISSASSSEDLSGRLDDRKFGSTTVDNLGCNNKLKTFRSHMNAAKIELVTAYQPYTTSPSSYPGYNEMWASFWSRHFKVLHDESKHATYDWQSEWASEWNKIMNAKFKKDMESKCSEIKKKLGINDADLNEFEKTLIQPPEVVLDVVKPITGKALRPSSLSSETRSPKRSRYHIIEHTKRSRSINMSSPCKRSRSPSPPEPCKISRARNTQEPTKRSRSSYTPEHHQLPTSNFTTKPLDRYSSTSQEQKTTVELLSNCQKPLCLEQLLDRHKRSGDFLISWRELLRIFEIEDISNSNQLKSTTSQIFQEPAHDSIRHTEFVDEKIAAVQEKPFETVQPVTIMPVLRILAAIENLLGSLAPKLIDLIETAIAMDKSKNNSSNTLLDDHQNCILFETIKEKLKGLLSADLVAENLQKVVRKAIEDMTDLIDQSMERKKSCHMQPLLNKSTEATSTQSQIFVHAKSPLPSCTKDFDNIAKNDEVVELQDSDIKVLMTNFESLSEKNKRNFTLHLRRLEISDPNRLKRIQNEILMNQTHTQKTLPDWEDRMYCPGEPLYSHFNLNRENESYGDENDKTSVSSSSE